jgi:hypothetical protein
MSDVRAIHNLLSGRYIEREVARHMAILRPLWDEETVLRLAPAAEVAGDSVLVALRDALSDRNVLDWRIMVVSVDALTAPQHAFMTARAHETYAIQYREACYTGFKASVQTNVIAMLHKSSAGFPRGLLSPSGTMLPPDLEHARYQAVGQCVQSYAKPDTRAIRAALLYTYLDFAANGMGADAKRLERLCEIAGTKAIPYGLRHPDKEGDRPTFLFIAR